MLWPGAPDVGKRLAGAQSRYAVRRLAASIRGMGSALRAASCRGDLRAQCCADISAGNSSKPNTSIDSQGARGVSERLRGKRCMITAAAAGIGRPTALAPVREGGQGLATHNDSAALASLASHNRASLTEP